MPLDRFTIAPFEQNSGMQNNRRPWLIPDEAFEQLTNAYNFRGRIRKRFGSRWVGNTQLSSRFRIACGTYSAPTSPVPAGSGAVGQNFSIENVIFTVNVLGTPANLLVANGSATTATFDTTTGAFVFAGVLDATGNPVSNASPIYYYPALPVMGLVTQETSTLSNEKLIGFDTRYAYQYVAGSGWERLATGTATWSGSNSDFFWGTTWRSADAYDKVLFVTNFNENETDYMRYLNGTTWASFRPLITATDNLNATAILVVFKNRLLAFNTWESVTATPPGNNYQNRVRWCQVGSPLDVDAWRQDIPGRGGGVDAPTAEAIVTVEFIKDRLIVFFERSTWELVYTSNDVRPFVWQQINTELGAESTFSVIPFDRVAVGVANVGIMACNGSNVDRIDDSIPDAVFEIHNIDSGVERVYGIRDYFVEMVYWTFPALDASSDQPYPNRVLVYNYKSGTWAFNEDSITAFGYIQPQSADTSTTWDSNTITWDSDETWANAPQQALFRNVIAGNQEGYTFIVDASHPTNAPVLSITDITAGANNVLTLTVVDHNLRPGDFIYITDVDATDNMELINHKIFKVALADPISKDKFTIPYPTALPVIAGTYAGGGVISRVTNPDILTKQYNFYFKQGRNAYVNKVEFQVDATTHGQTQVDYYVSTNPRSMVQASGSIGTNAIVGTNTLDTFPYPTIPFEADSTRLVHPVYFQADGEFIQFRIRMTDEQTMTVIRTSNGDGPPETFSYSGPSFEDFQLHSMTIYASPSSSRLQ